MIKDYFREFQTLYEYNEFITTSIRPNVSWVAENDSVHYGNELSDHTLTIIGVDNAIGETLELSALYDNRVNITSSCTWTIVSGGNYATVGSDGVISILSGASGSNITVMATYLTLTDSKNITVTYKAGTETHTEVEVTTDEEGNTTTTTTVIVENEDGSSQTSSSTIVVDESGNTVGSNITIENINADGSSTSSSIGYDENGNPTDALNTSGDTEGNVNTQIVDYDESGNSAVTSYVIDTSSGSVSGKTYNGDSVNTEYYAFDVTHGFVCDINFIIDFAHQPAGQSENHHNILTAKRADPSPWYGFQLRQSGTNKYIQLGTQFSTGSNTNTTINPIGMVNNVAEYNLTITYNPNATTNKFVCYDNKSGSAVYSSNSTFPDLEELKYLKVVLGCALDGNGDPFRYSNINVKNFSLRKLTNVAIPEISCDGEEITITCETAGASIYYKLNNGIFHLYSGPIAISADTVVEAYAELNDEKSAEIVETCVYAPVIVTTPIISCFNNRVTISCETSGASIFYRLNQAGTFNLYESYIVITANTTVEAYAALGVKESGTISELCVYEPVIIDTPVISCNGEEVTITCETFDVDIYYRLNQTGNYAIYSTPIAISADTIVEAYAELDGETSSVATETCVYDPSGHDYSKDYLTLRVISGGTIPWKSLGSGYAKTISYSINGGEWTSITASSNTVINVSSGDVVRLKGTNTTYAGSKANYSGFEGGTATYDIEGNIMSLVYGDNFSGNTALTGTYNFCSMFKLSNAISAENLILPTTTLTNYCYRAMFSKATSLEVAPALPATTLSQGCYWYMFEECAITEAPELLAPTLTRECYGYMFTGCTNLNYIKCLATNVASAPASALTGWVGSVAATGTFVKDKNTTWTRGTSGIPNGWTIVEEGVVSDPEIFCDGEDVEITCLTSNANIYYRLNQTGNYGLYTSIFSISADTIVEAFGELNGDSSNTVSATCVYSSETPYEKSNKNLETWAYGGNEVEVPYSVNRIDGHSASYAKGTFNFETSVYLKEAQPAHLWFQHADQSATIYVNNSQVEKHWGGYNAFFVDISNYVQRGTNTIKVGLKNNEGNNLAPAAGDFNYNATLGKVKLYTSPVLPDMSYGYDGFHITSDVATSSATIYVKTTIPTGATVVCTIDDGTYHYSESGNSTGEEMVFRTTISNPHLWNGTLDPHLYTVTLEIYHNNELYHRFERPYGLRFYEYVFGDTNVLPNNEPYTGFLLNGAPYLLRGVCMHDDLDGKANALNDDDYAQEFSIIQELGCNFIRLAHYPHPKEVYDWCDRLGIVVQTEVPCVNKMQSTMPDAYYTHLEGQYTEMVNQHYNHPCIFFWGLSNETTTDDKEFAKTKINGYTTLIKALDQERMVGYVMSHGVENPSAYYNNPDVDWFGCNLYVGWYLDQNSNNPSSRLNTRVNNLINNNKPMAYSEYGCGGTQHCHSDDFMTTTTRGNNPRHDIEYQMWLHEGHIAAIKNYPQLMFTSQWQLFDIAVASRNEGYTVCLDGENASIDDNLRRLNNKGLVERDHRTKKDTFYLYKAEWNPTPFVHICGQDYTKNIDRVIKCYTNDGNSLSLYVDGTLVETTTVTDHIANFSARTYDNGSIILVSGATTSDSFTLGHNYIREYLTFDILSDGNIAWKKQTSSAPTKTIYYSKNEGEWISITASESGVSIPVNKGDKIRFKGTNNTYGTNRYYDYFVSTSNFNVYGNIMSLSNGDNFVSATTLTSDFTFRDLFHQCTGLISAENLMLPATTLAQHCYGAMFYNCTNLTKTPTLSATILANGCYGSMFNGCTSLTSAPELPATTLASGCYQAMFKGCTNLRTAPELPATELYSYCYNNMFFDCTSLTTAPELPATTLEQYCYAQMFVNCTNLNYIKCLATDIDTNCTGGWVINVSETGTFVKDINMSDWTVGYYGIPSGWTVENYPPTHDYSQEYLTLNIISGGTIVWKSTNNNILKTISYSTDSGSTWTNIQSSTAGTSFNVNAGDTVMFKGDNTAYGSDYASYNTFSGSTAKFSAEGNIMSLVNSSGFTSATTLTSTNAFSSLFKDCTGLTTAEHLVLNATGLTNNCYVSMFENCTNLTIAPELPATTLSNYCYENMFKGCSSLSTAPSTLPATSLTQYCYASMFEGCTSITTSPELPAPILEQGCYGSMFKYCSSLNYIKCLATDISGRYALDSWVNGVAASGTFVKDANMNSWPTGNEGIPSGWTVQDAS